MADAFIARLEAADRKLFGPKSLERDSAGRQVSKQEQERDAAKKNYDAYVRSRDSGHLDWVEKARKFDAYYSGDQWEQAVVDELNAQNRPYATFNMVLSTINAIKAEYGKSRQEIAFRPRGKGATETVANALNSVVKQIQYNNQSHWKEELVLEDGLIEDRGYFDVRIDFSDNIHGEVREVVRDPRDVLLDPGAKEYDPSTWKEVITTRWFTPDEIEVFWGRDKADQLRNRDISGRFSHDSVQFDSPTKTFGDETHPYGFVPDTHEEALKIKRIRVIERQHKVLARGVWFVDRHEGDMRPAPYNWDDARVATHAVKYDLDIVEKPELRIRWTVSADDVLLYDDWSLYQRFTIIPFFPYFRRGKPHGLVRHLISPQDMLNKVSAQELHVVNTTANSGWTFESGSLINMDADDLEKVGARTGLVLEYAKGAKPPDKIQPNQVPAGLSNIASKAQLFFRQVSGLPETFLGFSSREVSGVAVQEQRQGAMGQIEVVLSNLEKTRHWRAEMYLELIQQFYTETRLIQVIELDIDGHEQVIEFNVNEMEQEVDEQGGTVEERILNDLTLGEYTVAVSSMPHSEAVLDSTFAQLVQMREMGVLVPDWLFYENSRIPDRHKIAEVVKQMQGMAEPTREEIEMQQMQQQLALEHQRATVLELMAKAAEREAKTELLLAQADATMQGPLLESQKAGVEMRQQLERLNADLQTKIAELQARIQISKEKNQTIERVAQIENMGRRMESALKRDADVNLERIRSRRSAA